MDLFDFFSISFAIFLVNFHFILQISLIFTERARAQKIEERIREDLKKSEREHKIWQAQLSIMVRKSKSFAMKIVSN